MTAGTLPWFAHHELRLAWRDWLSMITAGRRERLRRVVIAILVFAIFMHFVAYWMVGRYADAAIDRPMLVAITASILLSWLLMISQAMESMTRAFYSRSDLELILSSPVEAQKLFAVRIGAMALSVAAMSLLLVGPFIDVMAWRGGWRWFGAYGVLIAAALTAGRAGSGFEIRSCPPPTTRRSPTWAWTSSGFKASARL